MQKNLQAYLHREVLTGVVLWSYSQSLGPGWVCLGPCQD